MLKQGSNRKRQEPGGKCRPRIFKIGEWGFIFVNLCTSASFQYFTLQFSIEIHSLYHSPPHSLPAGYPVSSKQCPHHPLTPTLPPFPESSTQSPAPLPHQPSTRSPHSSTPHPTRPPPRRSSSWAASSTALSPSPTPAFWHPGCRRAGDWSSPS